MKKHGLNDRVIILIPVVYIICVSIYMVWHRAWFSPDQFFAFAILGVLLIGRVKQFLWDWIPMLLLLFGYEYLRGLVPLLTKTPNIWPMIDADKFLFGYIPSIKLQELLFDPAHFHWYDYASVTLYISHFVIPMVVALLFWLIDRRVFKKYMTGILVLSYLAFATYIIFPAMPPWMASNMGYISPLQKIMDQVMASFANPISVPSVYKFFGANLVAAVPSLHAAYPWLIFLFVREKIVWLGYAILPYVFGVWFTVVYLGEHYVVDAILGIAYATFSYGIIWLYTNRQRVFAKEVIQSEK